MRLTKPLLLAAAAAFALSPPVSAAEERPSPQLSATVDGVVGEDSQELSIERLDIEVRRHGSLATTEMTVRFANPTDQTLEGQFALSMPKGSIVTGYALDVNGVMIDGVLQPRDRARVAFEKRVVRRIDPGLAEVDFSDRFETRVYPIFPKQGRTIRIRFVSPLDTGQRYILPIETSEVGNFSISIRGITPDSRKGIKWRADGANFIATGNGEIDGEIAFDAPVKDGLTMSEHPGEGAFFELSGETPTGAGDSSKGALTIAWDRSVSRLDDELVREAGLAEKIARELGVSSVRLVLFDSGQAEIRNVAVKDLGGVLGNVRYAGGTSFDGLAKALADSNGTCILFTDGRATIGNRENLSAAGCRLVALGSGQESDRAWLEGQARMLGGTFVDIGGAKDEEVVQLALTPSALPTVTDSNKRAVEVRALPAANGRYRLVGPMPQNGELMVDGVAIRASSPLIPNFTAPGALWAAQHIALSRDAMGSEELAEQARRWSVAVPGVSFIVLETPEDYVEAGFVPPGSYPKDLRARFDQIKDQQEAIARDFDQAYRDELIGYWEARKRWWAGPQRNVNKSRADAAVDAVTEEAAAESRPMAPPPSPIAVSQPPPPPPARVTGGANDRLESDEDRIIVTASRIPQRLQETPVGASAVTDEEIEIAGDVTVEGIVGDGASQEGERSNVSSGLRDDLRETIETAEWSVDRPYIAAWAKAGPDWPAAVANTEKQYGSIPLFYLDLAEWHFRAGREAEARRAAEAALDLPSKDNQTLAIVAQRLLRYGDADRAIWLLKLLADTESDRPQPLMALSQAYAERGRRTDNRDDIVEAQKIMVGVAMKRWEGIYEKVGEIALAEANALIVELGGQQAEGVMLDSQFVAALPVDVRVVAEWNTPRTDLDLWVREPSGEEVGFSNETSRAGARYTHDLTGGYGPEEYQLREAPDGTYRIEINTFSVDRRNPNGPSVVTVRLIRNFATDSQVEETIDVEMQPDAEGRKLIGRIVID
ncbi:hypothetical protein GCM10023115_19140 [Pontixanthobacter gangjinensis]|uniref:VIT domain-containing protein n=1 Tax=Pontixanthobacter gangjinensis TaxID=1028742 RepID=A0A6I4SN37_9SPHN|nr:VIT domain-containing protein [Pontixanthobacter gangjinensis]MXO57163.1 hypothetical protein [Pontixanthobacter gangjinensis]